METESANETCEENKSNVEETEQPRLRDNTEVISLDEDINKTSFKVPLLLGPRPNKLKPVQNSEPKSEPEENSAPNITKKHNRPSKEPPPFPYNEPAWAGKPTQPYHFEVLKTGTILSNIDLSSRSYTVFGRLDRCEVVLEHPSVSRYHAIVQYRTEGDEVDTPGFYAFDLESTHGTFLNKQQLKPRTYYRMHVGHVLKLGGSSRMFILQGPEEDEEPESDLTVTEIKEQAQKRELAIKLGLAEPDDGKNDDNNGIDWGMGEDAVDEPIGENPFTLSSIETPNEELYIADPKKTLRGWFEREGYELEYKVEEKGVAHFTCRIELPIDVAYCPTTYAEATVKGKKKEAVIACALEACRILDRNGVLRQSQHESRKRKQKKWEDEDFYDSDEDTFLDRTGTIEKKRELRKKIVKKDEVHTFDTLSEKLKEIDAEIHEIQEKLDKSSKNAQPEKSVDEEDPLDAFMVTLSDTSEVDKKAKSRLRLQLTGLNQERTRLVKLVELARPTSLPPLSLPTEKSEKPKNKVIIGSMKGRTGLKIMKTAKSALKPSSAQNKNLDGEEFEVEEDDEDQDDVNRVDLPIETEGSSKNKSPVDFDPPVDFRSDDSEKDKPEIEEVILPKEIEVTPANVDNKSLGSKQARKRNERNDRKKKLTSAGYDSSNPDYAMWLPPAGQTGDGKTHLNDKFGY